MIIIGDRVQDRNSNSLLSESLIDLKSTFHQTSLLFVSIVRKPLQYDHDFQSGRSLHNFEKE